MSQPSYKLTYFDIRGLGEFPRLVLAAAGVPFEDHRLPFVKKEEGGFDTPGWPELKPTMPYGKVPVLTVDGKTVIPESGAIVRFLARRHGLMGNDEIEAALMDAGVEAVVDIRRGYFMNRSDPAKAAEYWSTTAPKAFANLEKNVKGPWFVGDKMSVADIAIYYGLYSMSSDNADAIAQARKANPKLDAIYKAVEADPKVAEYLSKRKETPM